MRHPADDGGTDGRVADMVEQQAAWVPCELCDDYWCNIHGMHVCDCECPSIDEWGDINPYFDPGPVVHGVVKGLEGHGGDGNCGDEPRRDCQEETRPTSSAGSFDHWRDIRWVECSDGKARCVPAQPEVQPLAHGLPNRVGTLRGAGNAIVPQVAAAFIQCFDEARMGL
jgi:hypothetical protein